MLLDVCPKVLSPRNTKILSGFLRQSALPQKHQDFKWVSASYVCSIWGQVRLPYGYVGAMLGPLRRFWGCVEGYLGSFWTMLLRHHLQNAPPWP